MVLPMNANEPKTSVHRKTLTKTETEKLKCSVCAKYLSVSPIHSFRDRHVCGRCPPEGGRDIAYEELAAFVKFPCTNKDCTRNLQWGHASRHERECLRREICCSVMDCHDRYQLANAEKHFDFIHSKLKHVDKFELSESSPTDARRYEANSDKTYLFINKGEIYFVFVRVERFIRDNLAFYRQKVAVYSARDDFTRYKAVVIFSKLTQSTVVTVDDRTYLFHSKRDNVKCETVANLGDIGVDYTATEVKLTMELYDNNLPTGPDCQLIDPTMMQACSICHKRLSIGPVYFSKAGYRCGRCPANGYRDHAFEELARHVDFTCTYQNCTKTFPWGSNHQEECPHSTIVCPVDCCAARYQIKDVKEHFDATHKEFVKSDELKLLKRALGAHSDEVFLLIADGIPYVVRISHRSKQHKQMGDVVECECGIRVCSPKTLVESRYKVDVTLSRDREVTTISKRGGNVYLLGDCGLGEPLRDWTTIYLGRDREKPTEYDMCLKIYRSEDTAQEVSPPTS